MADLTIPDEDFDRYIIGFTENQYHGGDSLSPRPCDSARGYNSPAIDYAERTNRGKERNFIDRSFYLDKQRSRSVSKIHTNILDLWHELSERRKSTPSLGRSLTMSDFPRTFSRLSDSSNSSGSTSSSMPIIEVQQLPPRPRLTDNGLPIAGNNSFGLPDINVKGAIEPNPVDKSSKTASSESKRLLTESNANTEKNTRNSKYQEPRMAKLVDELLQARGKPDSLKKQKTRNNEEHNADTNNDKEKDEVYGNDEECPRTGVLANRFKTVARNIMNTQKRMKELNVKLTDNERECFYRSENTSGTPKPKLSFCQSSYQERMEKIRINNIQRRHQSQTNTGPLDFNKLKKQIMLSRSRTLVW